MRLYAVRTSYALLPLLIAIACHSPGADKKDEHAVTDIRDAEAARYTGTYSGSFNKGIITLVLNYVSGKVVSGYDVHKGLRRNINGEVVRDGSKLDFTLKEPGDNPYDGTFVFSLDTANLKINGKWVPLDSTKAKVSKLTLTRKQKDTVLGDYVEYSTAAGGDTSLAFKPDGTCTFSFYERPQDSTSQLISIRGNYVNKKDTFRIEWQRGSSLPAMKMVRYYVRYDEDTTSFIIHLRGQGMDFTISGDED